MLVVKMRSKELKISRFLPLLLVLPMILSPLSQSRLSQSHFTASLLNSCAGSTPFTDPQFASVPMNLGKATKIKDPAAAKLAESISATMDDKPVDKESPSYGLEDEIDETDEIDESSAVSSKKPSGPSRKPGKSAVPKGFLNNKSRVKPQAEVR